MHFSAHDAVLIKKTSRQRSAHAYRQGQKGYEDGWKERKEDSLTRFSILQ